MQQPISPKGHLSLGCSLTYTSSHSRHNPIQITGAASKMTPGPASSSSTRPLGLILLRSRCFPPISVQTPLLCCPLTWWILSEQERPALPSKTSQTHSCWKHIVFSNPNMFLLCTTGEFPYCNLLFTPSLPPRWGLLIKSTCQMTKCSCKWRKLWIAVTPQQCMYLLICETPPALEWKHSCWRMKWTLCKSKPCSAKLF